MILTGSICLSDIPREQMKKVICKDGKERIYLNVAVIERKEPSQFGHTHFIHLCPKTRRTQRRHTVYFWRFQGI